MVVYLIVGGFVLFLIALLYFLQDPFKSLPGLPYWPLVGSIFHLGNTPNEIFQTFFNHWSKNGHDKIKYYIGLERNIIITSPRDVELVLTSSQLVEKLPAYRFISAWLGQGLLTATGQHWFRHRKIITPAFHFSILNHFAVTMNENADKLVKELENRANGKAFDIHVILSLVLLDVICETALGVNVDAMKNAETDFVKSVKVMNAVTEERSFSMVKFFDFSYMFTQTYKLQESALKVLRKFNDSVIRQRRLVATPAVDDATEEENSDVYCRKKRALMDTLLSPTATNGQPLSDEEIRDEVSTFIFTGHDTVSSALSSCIYCLAQYPEWQEKLFEEQSKIFNEKDDHNVSSSDITQMEKLDIFIKEVMRMYAPVPCIGRRTTNTFNMNGLQLPPKTNIIVYLYGMGHNPRYFDNPDKFDPERFLRDNRVAANPFEYVPFSAGSRNCVGQKFAMLNMKIFLTKIIRHYRFAPTDEIGYKLIPCSFIVYTSESGIQVKMFNREL